MIVVQIIVFVLGLVITLGTLFSAIKQTVLPGRKKVRLSRAVFRLTFRLFRLALRSGSEPLRESAAALYAPISVMMLPLTWVILLIVGFTAMFWAVGASSIGTAITLSGASLTTEGFLAPRGTVQETLYIIAGIIGLGIVGLLITFLPTVYASYSQREQEVTRVAFRFGAPPSGVRILEQAYRLGLDEELDGFWHTWEEWFTDMAETHISNTEVIFYHSVVGRTSWITTAGAILDACALFSSTVERRDVPWVQLCFLAGCRTLAEIASDVGIPPGPSLPSSGSIHVTRAEYDDACAQLSSAGVPLKADREASWRAFAGMRGQYDFTLLALAHFVLAPPAPWSSDRSLGLTVRDLVT
ncbi:MAG: hypothetical protein JO110_27190 [Acetobacteraceae bacterium]|nr:hypothetical protein [Acetobacteraceae bacterium]